MSYIPEEPPDENEAYESFDEALDGEDVSGPTAGPEGQRDLDSEIVADQTALEQIGANLDDPDRIALLDGGMDDPDGSGPPPASEPNTAFDAARTDPEFDDDDAVDPQLEIRAADATQMDQIPSDAPGPDSARW
jgi:hypothetical protein